MTEPTIKLQECDIDAVTNSRNLDDELVVTPEVFASIPDKSNDLCSNCAKIDFSHLMQLDCTGEEGTPVQALGDITDLESSSCPLCLFWGRYSPPSEEEDEKEEEETNDGDDEPPGWANDKQRPGRNSRYLRVFDFNETYMKLSSDVLGKLEGQATLLGVVRKPPSLQYLLEKRDYQTFYKMAGPVWFTLKAYGYICLTSIKCPLRTMATRLIDKGRVDLDIVRQWLNHCRDNHSTDCKRKTTSATRLKVIDCVTRKVVKAPQECRYVALSYMWGKSPAQPSDSGNQASGQDLPQLPKTIEDSISVTKELGLRYLWIDKYCIDQSDKEEKHLNIQQMDLIYAGAELSIIAAAGDNPNHGLPGYNGTSRNPQESLRLGDYLLTATPPHPGRSIEGSRWETRAWTYQEAVLSRRRLVFTSDQVLWECDEMSCAETTKVPLDLLHTVVLEEDILLPGTCFPFKSPGTDPDNIWSFIDRYYTKDMSYREDKLSAMQGIFKCFEKADLPVLNLSGIPVFDPKQHGLDISSSASFLYYLFWEMRKNEERMAEYPSWSWAGWQGGFVYPIGVRLQHLGHPELELPAIWLESITGSFEPFPESIASPQWLSINMNPRFFEIEAWTVPCSLFYSKPETPNISHGHDDPEGTRVRLPANESEYSHLDILLSSPEDKRHVISGTFSKLCLALIIPIISKGSSSLDFRIMVVGQKDEFWERVGHFQLKHFYHFGNERSENFSSRTLTERWFDCIPKTKRRLRLG